MGKYGFTIPRTIACWIEEVSKPTKHKKWQVKLHTHGSYPRTVASFDTKAEAAKEYKLIEKSYKPAIKLSQKKSWF